MKSFLPIAVLGLLLATPDTVHPQTYDRGPAPPLGSVPAPASPDAPPRRMVCIIDTPFPDHQQRCDTRPGYPGSPCRCEGSLFDGERAVVD